jgi:hypothetical protein
MSPPMPPFDDDTHEREWRAQEHARQAERLELDPAGDDARVRSYRVIARALRQPLPETLPDDFSQRVAAQVATLPAMPAPAGNRFESILLGVLAGIFLVAAAVVLARDEQTWLPALHAMLPPADPHTLRWPLAFVGCLALSWLLSQWQRRVQHRPFA